MEFTRRCLQAVDDDSNNAAVAMEVDPPAPQPSTSLKVEQVVTQHCLVILMLAVVTVHRPH